MRYSEEQFKKACQLVKSGMNYRKAAKECGIKTPNVVRYHCDPKWKVEQQYRGRMWRRAHPERWLEIARKASKKYYEKKTKCD